MTLEDFNNLDSDSQWDAIWILGKFVDMHFTSNSKYVLYAIDRFFVEVIWDIQSDNIIGKSAFMEGDNLDKYGGNIDFS